MSAVSSLLNLFFHVIGFIVKIPFRIMGVIWHFLFTIGKPIEKLIDKAAGTASVGIKAADASMGKATEDVHGVIHSVDKTINR